MVGGLNWMGPFVIGVLLDHSPENISDICRQLELLPTSQAESSGEMKAGVEQWEP